MKEAEKRALLASADSHTAKGVKCLEVAAFLDSQEGAAECGAVSAVEALAHRHLGLAGSIRKLVWSDDATQERRAKA